MGKPNNIKDYIGKKYGRWTILEEGIPQKFGNYYHKYVKCRCECGTEANIGLSMLKSGHSTSCGCYMKEWAKNIHTTHGLSTINGKKRSEYGIWVKMKQRCNSPKNKDFHHYGGRGIKVCSEWQKSFSKFIEDMGFRPSKEYSIERVDPNGDYCKENCKWILKVLQPKNTRATRLIEYNGEKLDLTDWCKKLNLSYTMMRHRITNLKLSFEEAMKYPKLAKVKKRLNL